jgi:hypothetical protein
MEAKLCGYEKRPYSKLIALRKQFNVLFQLLHRLCFLMMIKKQTEECDATASQENESDTGDYDAGPNFSLSADSYSDTSDNKSP